MWAAALAAVAAVAGAPTPPAPTRWVEDHVAFLTPATRDALDARLAAYEHATGHQVVVWIGPSLQGAALDDWAVRTFAAWKLGAKGKDDGLAIFILPADRAIDLEVGYGLEDRVPDAIASRIIREVMTPPLRAGQADAAVSAGVDAVLAAIEGKPWTAPAAQRPPTTIGGVSIGKILLGALAVLAFLVLFATNPRLAVFLLWSFTGGRRGDRGGGGGGGGGFHGGGGRSGGGGARGNW